MYYLFFINKQIVEKLFLSEYIVW